ncbi:oxidoreductase [Pseudonocardia lacus]|uniref:oxidoreductase n=1 Tax=Pseudonocardia lacus TaxID=2835865 RepID=UPI001BDD4DE4|nr:oxidoreductase [Pseudonocardia lacus]
MPVLASASQVPDQTGRTVVITGASSGIGRAAAAALAGKGARVVLAVRDQDRGRAAAAAMSGEVEVRRLDLASLASVRQFADGVGHPVDVLINNAGTMTGRPQRTADGFELQFGTNHLGHFALTNLLLDRITGRVVTVSSSAHRSARVDFDDLNWERRPYRPFGGAYGQSKLANLLFTAELQRRLTAVGSPVIATSAHPGWAATGFRMTSGNRFLDAAMAVGTALLAHGPESGALPTLLATVGDVPAGSFAGPSRFGGVRGPAVLVDRSGAARDPDVAGQLWEASERLTGTRFPLAGGRPHPGRTSPPAARGRDRG